MWAQRPKWRVRQRARHGDAVWRCEPSTAGQATRASAASTSAVRQSLFRLRRLPRQTGRCETHATTAPPSDLAYRSQGTREQHGDRRSAEGCLFASAHSNRRPHERGARDGAFRGPPGRVTGPFRVARNHARRPKTAATLQPRRKSSTRAPAAIEPTSDAKTVSPRRFLSDGFTDPGTAPGAYLQGID
jgi:hypothetical protein